MMDALKLDGGYKWTGSRTIYDYAFGNSRVIDSSSFSRDNTAALHQYFDALVFDKLRVCRSSILPLDSDVGTAIAALGFCHHFIVLDDNNNYLSIEKDGQGIIIQIGDSLDQVQRLKGTARPKVEAKDVRNNDRVPLARSVSIQTVLKCAFQSVHS